MRASAEEGRGTKYPTAGGDPQAPRRLAIFAAAVAAFPQRIAVPILPRLS